MSDDLEARILEYWIRKTKEFWRLIRKEAINFLKQIEYEIFSSDYRAYCPSICRMVPQYCSTSTTRTTRLLVFKEMVQHDGGSAS